MGSTSERAFRYYGTQLPEWLTAPYPKRQFGKDVAREFLMDPEYRNFNNGSFGTIPRAIRDLRRHYQEQAEGRPDPFIRYDWPALLEESRAAVAPLLGVDKDTVVFVSNATMAFNTILRNLVWSDDGADDILYFSTIYGACEKTIQYVGELSKGLCSSRRIQLDYPLGDVDVIALFEAAVKQSRAEGRRPRAAVMDVVSSIPGVRFPFEKLVAVCRDEGILSIIDGAQGIGLVDLTHIGTEVKPDFFLSNCHKWLFVPRGCAVLHVPAHNHKLMRSTLPTSWTYDPEGSTADFGTSFNFIGTQDNTNYTCVKESIRWRKEVLGGEEAILTYVTKLAHEGGRKVAETLGTELLENSEGTLTGCGMVNVGLPVGVVGGGASPPARIVVPADEAGDVAKWMQQALVDDYKTFLPVALYNGRFWVRLSAQVYLDLDDFESVAKDLLELCERVGKGDHKAGERTVDEGSLDALIQKMHVARASESE